MSIEKILVPEDAAGKRLDAFLASRFLDRCSRVKLKSLIIAGKVKVNNRCVKPNFHLAGNQELTVELSETPPPQMRAEKIPIEVVYEDADLLVVNKPAGMVVHPAYGNLTGTLVNALLYHTVHLSKTGGEARAGIVHRLDKNTSGLLVAAKNDQAHAFLSGQFRLHKIERVYRAVVKGIVQHDEMRCEEALRKSATDHRKVIVDPSGRESRTNFKVIKRFSQSKATLLEVRPETGRTHQIRVHLRFLGYPVLGDKDYGVPSPYINRQALHAAVLGFIHPKSKQPLSFTSNDPADFFTLLTKLVS